MQQIDKFHSDLGYIILLGISDIITCFSLFCSLTYISSCSGWHILFEHIFECGQLFYSFVISYLFIPVESHAVNSFLL